MVYDERVVAIYYDNIRIAQHRRDRSPNEYTTMPEHMPPEHRWYAQWSPSGFRRWARSIGEEVADSDRGRSWRAENTPNRPSRCAWAS